MKPANVEGDSSAPSSRANISPERRATVDRAREGWVRQLTDSGRRNNLIYFRDLKVGTLDLSDCDPLPRDDFLAGTPVSLMRLLPRADERKTLAQAQEIRRRAQSNLEERGLDTLFVAFGFATWKPADEGRPAQSPVILAPAVLESRGRDARNVTLRLSGEAQINPVLLHVLETEHGCKLAPELLLGDPNASDQGPTLFPSQLFAKVEQAAAGIKDFRVTDRTVLGNFSFYKMSMVKDLQENPDLLCQHDLIAGLAGDAEARANIRQTLRDVDAKEIDLRPPENEFLVLDADASRQSAILSALSLQSGVIHGPPGTGKSQTIANLITEFAARGRRVLFVAEKRAALDVVQERLRSVGLGHLTLDLHGAGVTRRRVMENFKEGLEAVRNAPPTDAEELYRRFLERRTRLNSHVARLHAKRQPSGLSVYELQGHLLHFGKDEQTTIRWRRADLETMKPQVSEEVCDLLKELAGQSALFLRTDPSPWVGALLTNGRSVEEAIDLAVDLAEHLFPTLQASADQLVRQTKLRAPGTLEELKALLKLFTEVNATLATFDAAIFQQDLTYLQTALAPGRNRPFAVVAWIFRRTYRSARRKVKSLCRGQKLSTALLPDRVKAAADQLKRWRALGSSDATQVFTTDADECSRCLASLVTAIERLNSFLRRSDLETLSLSQLNELVAGLASDRLTPYRLPRLLEIQHRLSEVGAGPVLAEIRRRQPDPKVWPTLFEHAWYASCLDHARAEDPGLAGFDGQIHMQYVEEFQRLDQERLQVAVSRVQRLHAEYAIKAMNQHPDQDDLVRKEANKRTKQLPLRRLVGAAPDVLTALRPCWLASPLSVSELLPAKLKLFDVVFFDEASQVLPHDAVPALLRAPYTVVAGDQHQLPPTTFFVTDVEDEDENESAGAAEGFESILDQMLAFVGRWSLDWHYRSKDERLIAFSNRHIYGDRLITFPSTGGPPAISHVLVPFVPGQDGQEESSSEEVRRVVQLVIEHATERPDESLGVIAMGIRHAERVQAALDEALKTRPDLDAFFDENREERFFVKNLERVQGDERDAIILTVGYGKDRSGRLPYRFGPLLTRGGERRLNVAITRAKKRMTVVFSFDHRDMDPGRSTARGVELLRLYLEYASSRGNRLGDPGKTSFPLNSFEADVHDTLSASGIPLIPQFGASAYRIDFVAQHPNRPGLFVLAIECDGATYHSAPTARDRDRLRQQHLEALGWSFHASGRRIGLRAGSKRSGAPSTLSLRLWLGPTGSTPEKKRVAARARRIRVPNAQLRHRLPSRGKVGGRECCVVRTLMPTPHAN